MSKSKWSFFKDEDLMQHFRKGENVAFDELYHRYYSKIYHYILHSTSLSKPDARDILHDVFTKIIEKKKSFDSSKKFSVWIYTLVNNECRNTYKHSLVKEKSKDEIERMIKSDKSRSLEIEQSKKIRLAVKNLKPIHKQVFLLRFNFGFSIKETANILDIAEGTVKSRLFNCIQLLNKQELISEMKLK
jgi:RNA polymerase sigma-70 factor (ECF subfamily)